MARGLRAAGRVAAALILVLLVALAVFVLVDRLVSEEDATGATNPTLALLAHDYDSVS